MRRDERLLLPVLGWTLPYLVRMINLHPQLGVHLLRVRERRIHLVALCLIQESFEFGEAQCELLIRGPEQAVLERVFGRDFRYASNILGALPSSVLSKNTYRRIVWLHSTSARWLAAINKIDEATIAALSEAPIALHATICILSNVIPVDQVANALRYLSFRRGAQAFERTLQDLRGLHQPGQIAAFLRHICDDLAFPEMLPPAVIGRAVRIDHPRMIRALARQWRICLGAYLADVDQGNCVLYLWSDATVSAVCEVRRRGRLGWFVAEVNGVSNRQLAPEQIGAIHDDFCEAGIVPESVANFIEAITRPKSHSDKQTCASL